jgi:hypothetical protein
MQTEAPMRTDSDLPTNTPKPFIENRTKNTTALPREHGIGTTHSARGTPLLADYLPERQAADELFQKLRTLRKWREQRTGPPWVRIGRRVFYAKAALLEWVRASETRPVRS